MILLPVLGLNQHIFSIAHLPAGLPPDHQRLIFNGTQIQVGHTLGDCGVTAELNTLHLIIRLGGRGCLSVPLTGFTDASKAAEPDRFRPSTDLPTWRKAMGGLCVEGLCTNARCEAYKQMVIANFDHGTRDLVVDAGACKCPQCRQAITPVACALDNCYWRFVGLKLGAEGATEAVRSDGWKEVGDTCVRSRSSNNYLLLLN